MYFSLKKYKYIVNFLINFNLKRGLFFYLFNTNFTYLFGKKMSKVFVYNSLMNYKHYHINLFSRFHGLFFFILLELFVAKNILLDNKLFLSYT